MCRVNTCRAPRNTVSMLVVGSDDADAAHAVGGKQAVVAMLAAQIWNSAEALSAYACGLVSAG
jgi:hypothetical protein